MTATDTSSQYTFLITHVRDLLQRIGLPDEHVSWLSLVLGVSLVFCAMGAVSKLLEFVLDNILTRFAGKTRGTFDDHLKTYRLPRYVARIIPLMLAFHLVPLMFAEHPQWVSVVARLFNVFFIVLFVRIVRAVLRAAREGFRDSPAFKDKPLDSYVQVVMLVLYLIAGILIFSQLTGRSALAFLTAMGAASAVLMLIFKDTILGFVASIQISANDMIRLGDWIEMPKYGADGDVIEINLTTVKVHNWDKTITTVPTYAMIGDSFKNWRGMQNSGGRRIKRSIRIKISSIRHLNDEELETLRGVQLLRSYIDERRAEIEQHNSEREVDERLLINGRHLTNIGLYRKYIELYIKAHPGIHPDMTRMVRQLAPDEHGLPLEIYCFTNDIRWLFFEGIMADIFDHALSVNEFFHLEIFESPASDDLRSVGTVKHVGG